WDRCSLLLQGLPLLTCDDEVELIPADPRRVCLGCRPVRTHAEALEHAERGLVRCVGAGTDVRETCMPKGIVDSHLGHFGAKPAMPVRRLNREEQFED